MTKSRIKLKTRLIVAELAISLTFLLPLFGRVFHESIYKIYWMQFPVLICGFICGPFLSILTGILGAVFSRLFTGEPVDAELFAFVIELCSYGFFIDLFFRHIRTGHLYADLYVSLSLSLIIGKLLAGFTRAIMDDPSFFTPKVWYDYYFVTPFFTLVLELFLVPFLIVEMQHFKLIPFRYKSDEKAYFPLGDEDDNS